MIRGCPIESAVVGGGPRAARRLVGVLSVLLALPPAAAGRAAQAATDAGPASGGAQSASTGPASTETDSRLSRVTIEAIKEQKLRLKVDHFVASVVAPPPSHESLMRWNKAVCPLVVGLPRNMGELILARISQAAREAHVPLAGRHCQPNLFVVVTPQPDQVLKKWMASNPKVDTRHGLAPLESFLHSTRPVRVWYNPQPGCAGGVSRPGSAALAGSVGVPYQSIGSHVAAGPPGGMGPTFCDNSVDTHLSYGDVRSIGYAIVVVDTGQLERKHVTVGQLAGYVSLVGLADIRTDADGGGAPTILSLFRDPRPPQGLTPWDQALLYSLYTTSQSGKLQLTDMEVSMTKRIGH